MTGLLIIFGIVYVLIATEAVDKAIAAGLGAGAVILLRYISCEDAFAHVDLNVIFLLIGMMTVVNIMSRTGVFEWLAVVIAKRARGNGLTIMLSLVLTTAVLSAVLDNVTTIILIAPVTILIGQILEFQVIPVLILEAVFSNIGGTATLVGDPPNILIGSKAGLSFNEFLLHLGPVVAVTTLLGLGIAALAFRKAVHVDGAARDRIMKTEPRRAIQDGRRLAICLGVFGLILLGFFLGRVLDVEPGIVALSGGLLMALLCKEDLHRVLGKVEWATILFFIGLFMLVGALQENGVFDLMGSHLIALTKGHLALTAIMLLWIAALVSAMVDNIPLVMAMIPLIATTVPVYAKQMGIADDPALVHQTITQPLYWALALGACLGGNGSLVGASANVVVSQIAHKNKYKLSFWGFTKVGFPMMFLSLIVSTAYLYLRYFL